MLTRDVFIFFRKKLHLMPALWTNPTRRRRQSPDIPPQLVSLLCTRHCLSFFSLWCLRRWCLRVHVNQLWFFPPLCNVFSLVKQNCLKVGNVLRRRGADNLRKDSSWNTTDNIFGCVVLFYFVNNNIGVAHYYVSERFGFWLLQYWYKKKFWFAATGTLKWRNDEKLGPSGI